MADLRCKMSDVGFVMFGGVEFYIVLLGIPLFIEVFIFYFLPYFLTNVNHWLKSEWLIDHGL